MSKIEVQMIDFKLNPHLHKTDVSTNVLYHDSPIQLEPVLAEIEHINDLGKSKWYEVVYFDENWQSYAGSKTFRDGEKVIRWKYVKDCL